jgi:hypothetical protein
VILQSLRDVKVELHENYGYGFDLTFVFDKVNPYFLDDKMTKKFTMSRPNVIDKTESSKINWKDC